MNTANLQKNSSKQILEEIIGNNTISLRELPCGALIVSVSGEVKSGKIMHRLDRAMNEFLFMCNKVTTYVYGSEHYN